MASVITRNTIVWIWALLGLVVPTPLVGGADPLPGPVAAQVITVTDGDTIQVRAHIWLGQEVEVAVRLVGVDAPERRGACADERRLAEAATQFVERAIGNRPVQLHDIAYGKYAGRVLARIEAPDGTDLGTALVAAGLARPYGGRTKRRSWCNP